MYTWKRVEEIGWAAGVAAGVAALTVLVQWNPDTITDYRTWAVALLGGCVRAAAGAVLATIGRPR